MTAPQSIRMWATKEGERVSDRQTDGQSEGEIDRQTTWLSIKVGLSQPV